ncbi:hypothetical protein [Pontiella agarivorans]|uniref:WG containing repeat-containing protein n=1 Tax=Pontiella agarivorans TaxID=3038953 RepID=A0ABU5N0M5_9BACT|nr:hypothetical protein [Pontiella agarivorans]MDZ8119911.1 hypothetical protein [Pontiella agarivorans]
MRWLTHVVVILPLMAHAQTTEQLVSDLIADAPNGFNAVAETDVFQGLENGGEILGFDGWVRNGEARYMASVKLAEIDEAGRRTLHEKFQAYRNRFSNRLAGWERESANTFFYGSDTFTKKESGSQTRVILALENVDGTDMVWLRVEYIGPGSAPIARLSQKTEETPNLIQDEAPEIPVLKTEKGQQALLALLDEADTEFRDVRIATDDPEIFHLPETVLNPPEEEPRQLLRSTGPMRYELELWLVPKYGFDSYNLPQEELEDLLTENGWVVEHKNRRWTARPENSRAKRLVKKAFRGREYLVLEMVKEAYRPLVEKYPHLTDVDCLSGDCINGYASIRYLTDDPEYRYEGFFKEARPDGLGMQFMSYSDPTEDPLPAYIGNFKNGERHGPGISYQFSGGDDLAMIRKDDHYFTAKDEVLLLPHLYQEYENGELLMESEKYWLHHQPQDREAGFLIKTPFAVYFGKPVSGDCQNGEGMLELPGLGTFSGSFENGRAQGYGELTLPNGEIKAFVLHDGVPEYIRTLALPEGVSRIAAAKRGAFQLAVNDCLEGNCLNGEGVALMGSADLFSVGQYDYEGIYRGGFKNGKFHGQGTMLPFVTDEQTTLTIAGTFEDGMRQGRFVKTRNGEEEIQYFKDDVRYTESGQLFSDYLAEDLERRRAEYKKLLAEKIEQEKRRLAAVARRNEEIRKRNEARKRAAKRRRAPRRNVLYSQTFSGRSHRIPAYGSFGILVEDLRGKGSQEIVVEYIGGYGGGFAHQRYRMSGGVLSVYIGDENPDPDKPRLTDPELLNKFTPSNYYIIHCSKASHYQITAYN